MYQRGSLTLIALIIGGLILSGGLAYLGEQKKQAEPSFGAFGDPFISIQLATDPDNGECLTTDGTDNVWSTSCGSSGTAGGWETKYANTITPTNTAAGIFVNASSTIDNQLKVGGELHASSTLFVDGLTSLQAATSTNLGVTSLAVASCDVKAAADGSLYCGSDATGASVGAAWNEAWLNAITPTNTLAGIFIPASSTINSTLRVTGALTAVAGLTISTGQNLTIGTTQWNSGDEFDGTKIKDADYGDVVVDAAGDWQVSEASDLNCTDCINATEIDDVYLLNNGDTGTGSYIFSGDARIATINSTTTKIDTLTVNTGSTFPANDISDAEVSDTLTASNLVAGSEVVADTEVVDALTLNTSIEGIFTGNIRVNHINASTTLTTSATTTNFAVKGLTAASCDVKATTDGVIYCGTDAVGSGIEDINDQQLGQLADVSTTTIATADILMWDGANWINQATTSILMASELAAAETDPKVDTGAEIIAIIDNAAVDVGTGVWTFAGVTLAANENITLGAQTLDHDGTDFVFSDSVSITGNATSSAHIAATEFLQNGTPLAALYQPLEATLTDIADGTIAENLVNTANPWADNEVADALTVTGYMQDEDINTIAELQAWISDADVVQDGCTDCLNATEIEDIYLLDDGDTGSGSYIFSGDVRAATINSTTTKIDTLTVHTGSTFPANDISDAEVSDTLTASNLVAGSEVVADAEVVDALTLNTSIEGIFTGNIRANRINATSTMTDHATTTDVAYFTHYKSCTALETDADGLLTCGTDDQGAGTGSAAWEQIWANAITPTTTTAGIFVKASSTFNDNLRVAEHFNVGTTTPADNWGMAIATTTIISATTSIDNSTFIVNPNENRIGMGIVNPATQLHLHDANGAAIRLTSSNSGATETDGLIISQATDSANFFTYEAVELNIGNNNTAQIHIDEQGDINIGSNADTVYDFTVHTPQFTVNSIGGAAYTTSTGAIWVGAAGTANSLDLSGGDLYVQDDVEIDGSLWGAGLADCDTAATSKLLWDTTTGQFSCGTDQNTGGSGAGAWQAIWTNGLAPTNTSAGIFVYASSTFNSTLRVNGKATSTDFWVGTAGTASQLDFAGGDLFVQDDLQVADDATFDDITVGGGNINTGNLALTIGDATTDSITFTADGTGNAEFTFPADVIADADIDWGSGAGQVDLADIPGGISGASVWDFGGATSLEIPNAAAPGITAVGMIGLDTTANQLIYATSTDTTGGPVVFANPLTRLHAFTIASSTALVSGDFYELPVHTYGFTVVRMQCHTKNGTSVLINLSDDSGTNDTAQATCTPTSEGQYVTTTSNAIWNPSEEMRTEIGTNTGGAESVSVSVFGVWTRQ